MYGSNRELVHGKLWCSETVSKVQVLKLSSMINLITLAKFLLLKKEIVVHSQVLADNDHAM